MARVYTAGFETGDLAELTSTSGSIATDQVHGGNYSWKNPLLVDVIVISPLSECFLRFWFRKDANPSGNSSLLSLRDSAGSQTALLVLNADGTIGVEAAGGTRQNGSTVLSINTWYRINFRYKKGTGSNAIAEFSIDGGAIEASSTNGTGTADVERVRTSELGLTSVTRWFDDIAIDGAAFPGDGSVYALRPNAVGTEDNFSNTFAEIDDLPPDDTTGRVAPASGSIPFLNNLTTVSIEGGINDFLISVRAKRGTGQAREHYIRSKKFQDFVQNSPNLALTAGVVYYTFRFDLVPTTQAELDGHQAGMTQSAAGGQLATCTEVYAMVEVAPSGAPPSTVIQDIIGRGVVAFAR